MLHNWINSLIKNENKILGKINLIFSNDRSLLFINQKYLDHQFYTDVISFYYIKNIKIFGDIYLSIDRVKENSLKWGVSFESELYRVMVHGILHLLSYKDKYQFSKSIMKDKEIFYLKLLLKQKKNKNVL